MPLRVLPERRLPADWSLPGHCPAQEARCPAVGNTAHVGADLGDHAPRRCAARRRGSCAAARRRPAKGRELAPRSRQRAGRSCSSRKSMCARIAPIISAWWASKRPSSASRSAGIFVAQPALGQLGEHLGVGGAGDERVEHRAAGHAEDVGRDAVELDPGVLERLVQPVGLARALLDLRLAIAGQVAQLPHAAWAARSSRATARPPAAGTATRRP